MLISSPQPDLSPQPLIEIGSHQKSQLIRSKANSGFESRPMSKRMTNIEFVIALMAFSKYGAMANNR